jgi:hypothetical protein
LNVDQINKALFGAVKYLSAKVEALEQSLATATASVPEVVEPVVEVVEAPETASVPEVAEVVEAPDPLF